MTALDLDDPALDAPLHPAANPEELALLAWARDNAIGRPNPPIVGGRYRLPPPDGGKERAWTRMSTLAKTLDDTSGLEIWRNRCIAAGFHTRRDLLDAIDPADKASLTAAANAAALHGGDKLRADLGTAMHTALEHLALDTGTMPPEPWADDALAIADAIAAAGLTFPPEYVEATLVNPQLEAAGRTDLVARGPWGDELRICDLKTGSDINRSLVTYAAQLAGYATSTHRWTGDSYAPFTGIDQGVGIIIHAPLGTGTCTIHEVDLTAGAEIVALCATVRKRRTGAAKLATATVTATSAPPAVPAATNTGQDERAAAIKTRLAAIDPEQRTDVVRGWPHECPPRPPWTIEQCLAIEAHLYGFDGIEAPFAPTADEQAAGAKRLTAALDRITAPTPEPAWQPPDNGPLTTDAVADAIRTEALETLDDTQRALAAGWQADARRQKRPWGSVHPGQIRQRTLAINLAALSCLQAFSGDEALTRRAIGLVINEHPQPVWTTGALLGSLTIDQATDLDQIATRYLAGDTTTRAELDAA